MTYSLTFELKGLPRMITNGSQGSWRAMHFMKKQWGQRVFVEVYNKRPPHPLLKSKITFTRFSAKMPDFDNLAGSFKCIADGLVRAMIIIDDSMNHIEPVYKWEKCKPREGKIRVEITGVENGKA